jgi:hypothetical protein
VTRAFIALAIAAGCGRFGFDEVGLGGDGVVADGDGVAGDGVAGDGVAGDGVTSGDTSSDGDGPHLDGAPGEPDAPIIGSDENLAFVTSTVQVPGVGGLDGVDGVCRARAEAAGLAGTFVGYVSASGTSARSRLAGSRGWVRTDFHPFADTVEDIAAGRVFYPLRLDESGNDVGFDSLAATGSNGDGTASGSNCSNFAIGGGGSVTYGSPHAGDVFFTANGTSPCSDPVRFYCFEVGHVAIVAPPVVGTNRLAFRATWTTPGSGRAAADAACQTAGGAGGLFKALLGLTTETAASRFDGTGAPWVRPDGVALAPTAAAFLAGTLDAPIVLDAAGNSASVLVATGGPPNVLPTTSTNCGNWGSGGGQVMLGLSIYSGLPGYQRMSFGCAFVGNVYCLEE